VELENKLELFKPSDRLFINVHIDGMEQTHDAIVQRQGVFAKAVAGIQAAKRAGFMVCTNTTVYQETDIHEVAVLFEYLSQFKVDGFMLSPAYGYESVCESDPQGGSSIFMTRDEIHERFRQARKVLSQYRLVTSPVYFDFLCGQRDLTCAAWANPTYNIRGWKGPCYLITDEHYQTYQQLVDATDWDTLGPGNDPRCEHCLVHCGFEPAAVFSANHHLKDILKMAVWQMT
jgi:hopanoid biosynthesis associated radical SAM protein HpnH